MQRKARMEMAAQDILWLGMHPVVGHAEYLVGILAEHMAWGGALFLSIEIVVAG